LNLRGLKRKPREHPLDAMIGIHNGMIELHTECVKLLEEMKTNPAMLPKKKTGLGIQ
jgi:hypothetical protein